jgi:hypothetical protein
LFGDFVSQQSIAQCIAVNIKLPELAQSNCKFSEEVSDANDQNASGRKEQNLGSVNSSKHGHLFSVPLPNDNTVNNGTGCFGSRALVRRTLAQALESVGL